MIEIVGSGLICVKLLARLRATILDCAPGWVEGRVAGSDRWSSVVEPNAKSSVT